ncbi:MAG: ABC transporter substrate-binding protein [Myxococcota bacterium]
MSAVLALVLAGCSLGTTAYTPCETHAECRDAFGFGSVCAEDGLCADAEVDPRCERTWPPDLFERPESYADAYVLGSLLHHESPLGLQAAELAVRQVNDSDGLDGRPFALVACDYQTSFDIDALTTEEAVARTTGFLAETLGVPAIVGPGSSATAEVAYAVAAPAGTVLVSPSATSPYLTGIDGDVSEAAPGLFWRTVPSDALQGAVLAQDIHDTFASSTVTVIYQKGPYGDGLVDVFLKVFDAAGEGVRILSFTDETDRNSTLHLARAEPPEVALFISSSGDDVVAFLNTVATWEDWPEVGLYLTDTARTQDVLDQTPAALLPRLRGTAAAAPDSELYRAFLTAYTATFSPDNAASALYTAHTWDAMWLSIAGVAWAASNEEAVTGIGVARGLRHVSEGEPAIELGPEGWSRALRPAFAAGRGVDVRGASGELDFADDTEETTAPIEVWTVRDGKFHSEYSVSQ